MNCSRFLTSCIALSSAPILGRAILFGDGAVPAQVDVAIVGGGPAGLAAAIGIRRALGPSAKIGVFERASSLCEVGGQVGLQTPAFSALDALDPSGDLSRAVSEAGCRRRVLRRMDERGTLVDKMTIPEGTRQSIIPWFRLQQVMLESLRDDDEGSAAVLHLGCELESLSFDRCGEGDEGPVCLKFSDGRQCTAKIVVGADGNLSKVRAMLFGQDEVFPEFAGACIWRMFLKGDCPGLELGVSNVWTGDGKVLCMQKMGKGDATRVYVSGQTGWPEDQLHVLDRQRYIGLEDGGVSGGTTCKDSRLARFLAAFEQFPRDALDFVANNCEHTSILEHPIYFRPPGRPWGSGRVTLIGDAAHIITPNMAMGTPLAFEDAVSLSHAVARHGLTSKALREYETERQPRVNRIAEAAIRDTGLYYKEKNDDGNPFKLNDADLWKFIASFRQDPVPTPIA